MILPQNTSGLRWLSHLVILFLAAGLTLASLRYVQPVSCYYLCMTESCPYGYCTSGEQGAGFPLPVLQDNNGGGSPMDGWGKMGPEDSPSSLAFLLNVLFYSGMLWLFLQTLRRLLRLGESYGVIVLGSLVTPLIFGFALLYPAGLWWFIRPPPVPQTTTRNQVYYSAHHTERVTEFEAVQSAESLRQFYATELPQMGWRYTCSLGLIGRPTTVIWTYQVRPPCSLVAFSPGAERIDVYERDPGWVGTQLLALSFSEGRINMPSGYENRVVRLHEFR